MTAPDDPWGPVPDADPLDELASALVDGEATDEERARADDPEVAARVAAFEVVARRLAEPVPPVADADREAAIRAALDAVVPGVSSLDTARERRDVRRRRLPEWLPGVAAAVAIIGGLGLLFAALPSGDDDDESATMATESAGEDAATFDSSAGGAAEQAAPAPSEDVGEFADVPALVDALRQRDDVPTATSTDVDTSVLDEGAASDEAVQRNAFQEAQACGVEADEVLTAVVADLDVVVGITTDGASGERRYVVVDALSCQQLDAGEL